MPKKEREYIKNINVRISKEEEELWERFRKENHFNSISSLVRFCVNERIEGSYFNRIKDKEVSNTNNRIKQLENNNKEILKTQNKILKFLTEKTTIPEDTSLWDYQKTLGLNLLEEKPRDEVELSKLLDLDEIKTLKLLNGFIELGKIKLNKDNKYEMII
ncbi:hypothetical protein ES702_02625 [subsurface metagenome]